MLYKCLLINYLKIMVHVWNIFAVLGVLSASRGNLMRDPKNEDLLTRLQSGDDRAIDELADAYNSKIYQLAFRYLRNKEDAEEITQDVLFKVYRKVGDFRGDAALSSWIYRITFNAAMSRMRTTTYQRSRDEERQSALAEHDELGMPAR